MKKELSITVRGVMPSSLNVLLRGAHPQARSSRRRVEKAKLRTAIAQQNPIVKGYLLCAPIHAQFTLYYATARPDIDGVAARCKLLFDALQDLQVFADDNYVESLLALRVRVPRRKEQGFDLKLRGQEPGS